MSTSPSDKSPGGNKTGVGSLFKRAVAEQDALGKPGKAVDAAVVVPKCPNCTAPRMNETLVCSFCGHKL